MTEHCAVVEKGSKGDVTIVRNPDGTYAPGTGGGPGRKKGCKGRRDIVALCERHAQKEGHDIDDLLWEVMKGLMLQAEKGNMDAARLVLRYLGQPVDDTPQVAIDARQVHFGGPPIPQGPQLADYLDQVQDITAGLRITSSSHAQEVLGDLL